MSATLMPASATTSLNGFFVRSSRSFVRSSNFARVIVSESDTGPDSVSDRYGRLMEVDVEEECLKVLAMYQPVAADLRFAADTARFGFPFTRLGVCPEGASTYYLPRLVGMRRAQEMFLLNRVLTAAEALDAGLVTEVVPADELAARAHELAAVWAAGPAGAYGQTRRLLRAGSLRPREDSGRDEAETIRARASLRETQALFDAFLGR